MSQVPAVILVCRNSTDTAYFQRLRPYPRIMLLRYNTRFKDYVSLMLTSLVRGTIHQEPAVNVLSRAVVFPSQGFWRCHSSEAMHAQDKTPIGFGVAIFCIAKASNRYA